jgi:hypothetical protein
MHVWFSSQQKSAGRVAEALQRDKAHSNGRRLSHGLIMSLAHKSRWAAKRLAPLASCQSALKEVVSQRESQHLAT